MSPDLDLDLDHLLTVAIDAAVAAGAIVRDGFAAPQNVREKHPGDLVSDTDVASERSIRTALERAAPEIAFFGEEEGGERADVGWFADPLDGTANFVHGFPSVGVSIGLVVDGAPVLGVVYAPMLGNLYSARQGGGAFRDGERIFVSQRVVASAIPATGFPFRAKRERLDEYLPVFERALREFEDLRRAGRREPRPRLDRGRRLRRLFRAESRHLGRRRGRADRARGRRRGHRLAGRRTGLAHVGRHRGRPACGARAHPRAHRRRRRSYVAIAIARSGPMLRRKRTARSPSAV